MTYQGCLGDEPIFGVAYFVNNTLKLLLEFELCYQAILQDSTNFHHEQ